MLLQISDHVPEVKERYFIDNDGVLYSEYGKEKLHDDIKNGYVKNSLVLKGKTIQLPN